MSSEFSPHDKETLRALYVCFDRPAFRVNFEHESDLEALIAALDDTIAAINTGVTKHRDGTVFGRAVEGKAYFDDVNLRESFDEIVDTLTGAKILYAHAKRSGFFFGQSPYIAFHRDHPEAARVALAIDEARNRALEIANDIYRRLGMPEFPYIRSPEYYEGYEELQRMKEQVVKSKFLSVLDMLEIKPKFFGVSLNVSSLIKMIARR